MSLKSEAWLRPDCLPTVSRLPSDCLPTVSQLRSARFVVPCFRCPALNKLAWDQYSYFSYYLLTINLL